MNDEQKSEIKMYQDSIEESIREIMIAICDIRENQKNINNIINNNKEDMPF